MSDVVSKKVVICARDKIVIASLDLFHERGIHATSVDDILKKSGTGKSQFYHYFGSKEGLVHAAMDETRRRVIEYQAAQQQAIDSWDDLHAWLHRSLDEMAGHGFNRTCPMGRFASEMTKEDEAIRRGVMLVFETIKKQPREFFIKVQARGELPEDVDPDAMADFCISVVQGGCLVSKVYRDRGPMNHSIEAAFSYLRSLSQ